MTKKDTIRKTEELSETRNLLFFLLRDTEQIPQFDRFQFVDTCTILNQVVKLTVKY